jgi:hypothetical protein
MHRPACPGCRFNRRASDVVDEIFASIALALTVFASMQLWLLFLLRKALPATDACREHSAH